MSVLFRIAGAGAIFLTSVSAPFNYAAAPLETGAIASSPEFVPPPAPPTEEEAVATAVLDFKTDFAKRVASNDYSNPWNACFGTATSKNHASRLSNYSRNKVKDLRQDIQTVAYRAADTSGYIKPIIVLDLGHGHQVPGAKFGYDTGTISKASGLKEVEVIDSVAVPLKEKLEHELGAIVVPTRTPIRDGVSLRVDTSKFANQKAALQIRAEMAIYLAKEFPNAPVLFVSLHGNTGAQAGTEVYYYAPTKGGATDSQSSKALAQSIKAHYTLRAGTTTHAISNDYAVLRCQTNPAVLIELGYLSDSKDRTAFKNTDRISNEIAQGVGAYLHSPEPKPLPKMQIASAEPQ